MILTLGVESISSYGSGIGPSSWGIFEDDLAKWAKILLFALVVVSRLPRKLQPLLPWEFRTIWLNKVYNTWLIQTQIPRNDSGIKVSFWFQLE